MVTYLAFPFFVAFFLAFLSLALPPSSLSLSNQVFFLDFAASAVDMAHFRLLGAMDGGGELFRRQVLLVWVSMMVVGAEEW